MFLKDYELMDIIIEAIDGFFKMWDYDETNPNQVALAQAYSILYDTYTRNFREKEDGETDAESV